MQADRRLSCDAASVRIARRFVAEKLSGSGADPDVVDTAELLASELVSNAVLHAHTDIEVTVHYVDGRARVAVADANARGLSRRRHSLESATGRGLLLVEQMAAAWGVEPRPGGKAVWFEVQAGLPASDPDLDAFLALDPTT